MQKSIGIGEMYRSGATLTETTIGTHPDISIPPRDFHFLKYYEESKNLRMVFNILEKMEVWGCLKEEIGRKNNSVKINTSDFTLFSNSTP